MEKSSAAILIRKTPLTNTSLVVHWCTPEHGLIRTAARGARRPGSPFAGKLDLFYTAEILWLPAKRSDLHTLKELQVRDHRPGIQLSWARMLCASYFVKLLETVAEPHTPLLFPHDLLRRALDYLNTTDPTPKAVLHYERELAKDLGIFGESGVSAIMAIHNVYHRVPEQREALMRHFQRPEEPGAAAAP